MRRTPVPGAGPRGADGVRASTPSEGSREIRPTRRVWTGCLVGSTLTLAACLGTVPPVAFTALPTPESLSCAEDLLVQADYEVERTEEIVVGEIRILSGELGGTREFIRVAVVGDAELKASVEAFRLEPSMSSLPVDRQTALRTAPSELTRGTALQLIASCGR